MISIGKDGDLEVVHEPALPLYTNVRALNKISRIPYCWGRRKGVTWAAVHNMAGLIENLPNGSSILYIVPLHDWTYHIRRHAEAILEDHGIEARYDGLNKSISVGNTRVFFVSTDIHRIQGFSGYRVFDAGEARYYSYLGASPGVVYKLRDFWHRAQMLPTMRFKYRILQGSEFFGRQIIRGIPEGRW